MQGLVAREWLIWSPKLLTWKEEGLWRGLVSTTPPILPKLVSPTECCGDTNDDTLARKLFGEVDLVTRGVLDKVNAGDGVALLDECGCGAVEGSNTGARDAGCETTSSEHYEKERRKKRIEEKN